MISQPENIGKVTNMREEKERDIKIILMNADKYERGVVIRSWYQS